MLGKFRPRHYLLSTTLLGSAACISPAYAQDVPGGETVIEDAAPIVDHRLAARSEEHTSELQSLMRISYAVFCLKKKNKHRNYKPQTSRTTANTNHTQHTTPN